MVDSGTARGTNREVDQYLAYRYETGRSTDIDTFYGTNCHPRIRTTKSTGIVTIH